MNTDDFLLELSQLGRKHGLGITGSAVLFVLERDDYAFDYSVDAESRLFLGNPQSDAAAGSGRDAQGRLHSLARP